MRRASTSALAFGIGIQRAVGGPDVHRWRAEDIVAFGADVRIIGAEDEVFAALAFVGSGLAGVGDRALPEIGEAAGGGACGDFEHQRAGFLHVGKRHDVGRGGVGGEKAEFVLEGEVIDIVEIACAELGDVFLLPLLHDHDGKGPEVGLAGALVVDLVEHFCGGLFGRIAVFEFEFSGACVDRAGGGQLLCERTGEGECTKSSKQRGERAVCFVTDFHGCGVELNGVPVRMRIKSHTPNRMWLNRSSIQYASLAAYCFDPEVTASITRSRLKLPGFWRGGNSRKL